MDKPKRPNTSALFGGSDRDMLRYIDELFAQFNSRLEAIERSQPVNQLSRDPAVTASGHCVPPPPPKMTGTQKAKERVKSKAWNVLSDHTRLSGHQLEAMLEALDKEGCLAARPPGELQFSEDVNRAALAVLKENGAAVVSHVLVAKLREAGVMKGDAPKADPLAVDRRAVYALKGWMGDPMASDAEERIVAHLRHWGVLKDSIE